MTRRITSCAKCTNCKKRRGTPCVILPVLMRVNSLSRSFEERFMQYGIAYRVYGGFKFIDHKGNKGSSRLPSHNGQSRRRRGNYPYYQRPAPRYRRRNDSRVVGSRRRNRQIALRRYLRRGYGRRNSGRGCKKSIAVRQRSSLYGQSVPCRKPVCSTSSVTL